ncbi:CopG family transcriptional regulator [Blautia coccoides]|uniref:ribbon-helix-helix domain-containing protein n=1 Tax=Blautia producta TaxID=33035 RepID=UPI0028A4C6F5|nr:CopG family transcriptional regulator [Blautia coccoides]MDT4377237.1 CopG family transcriptional regulator [Blautia coccoides]
MAPRTGRPKSSNPKRYDIKVRFDEEGHEALIEFCENNNTTRTEVIRRAVEEYLERQNKKK